MNEDLKNKLFPSMSIGGFAAFIIALTFFHFYENPNPDTLSHLYLSVGLFGFLGWFMNTFKLGVALRRRWDYGVPIRFSFLTRIVGIFVPWIGAIVGYLTLDGEDDEAKDIQL